MLTEEREHNPASAKESLLFLGVCSLFFCHHHTTLGSSSNCNVKNLQPLHLKFICLAVKLLHFDFVIYKSSLLYYLEFLLNGTS